jgi:hypothetical protein
MLFSKGEEIRGDFSDYKILPGDTLIVYGLWNKIEEMKSGLDFVVATPFKSSMKKESKLGCRSMFSFFNHTDICRLPDFHSLPYRSNSNGSCPRYEY